MTRILRLLLIAAIALPLWQPAAAQEAISLSEKINVDKEMLNRSLQMTDDGNVKVVNQTPKNETGNSGNASHGIRPKIVVPVVELHSSTICDGATQTSTKVPFYGNYFDTQGCRSQMLYPSSYLTDLAVGDTIYNLRFYTSGSAVPAGMGTSTIRIGLGKNTNQRNYYNQNSFNSATLTTVYEDTLATGRYYIDITFTTPYVYQGGDLVIDTYVVTASGYANCTWTGISTSNYQSKYNNNSSGWGADNDRSRFLPQVTIYYKRPTTADIDARDIVVKDSTFFAGIEYKWPYNAAEGSQNTSKLTDIATDPDQIIAMLREIYMNTSIPGNLKRGFYSTGANEAYNEVNYGGVGSITRNTSGSYNSISSYSYVDSYGWGISGNLEGKSAASTVHSALGNVYYAYMDSTQYRPLKEGITLLLVELVDNFDKSNMLNTSNTDPYLKLRDYIKNTIKSVRVVCQAKRTGIGLDAGTLFKVDCDKMNKFYFMAKGQLRWLHNSYWADFTYGNNSYTLRSLESANPAYICNYYGSSTYNYMIDDFYDDRSFPLCYNMFEEFSPVANDAAAAKADIYQDLVNMESFGVEHDCMEVPYMGHQFMMYGEDSDAADCQDVRDLMFFVPDYRMLKDETRDNQSAPDYQKFMNYNTSHQPSVGLYVIRQNEITPTTEDDDYYMLNLNWVTNLDDFLPGEDQEFELLQVVINDSTGIEEYKPVYYMNAQGQYIDRDPSDPAAQVVDEANRVPIVLHLGSGAEKNYPSVYVARQQASQQVTYAIRGRDAGHFLSLQISNRQSYIIPGKDPQELVSLIELAHYSRYNPQNEENCYSNRFKMSNNAGGVRRADITSAQNNQTVFTFTRKTSSTDENPVTIATATVTNRTTGGGTITIVMQNQDEETEFPRAKNESGYAGYHANPGDGTTWTKNFTYKRVNGTDYVDFGDFVLCDNFIAEVSENAHPNLYIYEVHFNIARGQEGPSGQLGAHDFDEAHGSAFSVPIYKTASKVNNAYSLIEVKGDKDHAIAVDDFTFSERVQYSSKTEILRYDVYRWPVGETRYIVNSVGENDAEQDLAPDGIAGNQGEGYTVTMNDVDGDYYYNGGTVAVSSGTAWADFVDYYPAKVAKNTEEAKAYVYAPVVETFTVGKNVIGEVRTDYNTYGGSQQSTAVGVLDVNTPNYSISSYSWLKGNDRYAYYTVNLPISTDAVPNGYKIYMVRAWRVVDPSLLDEPLDAFAHRKTSTGEYMFEEMLGKTEEGITEFLPQGGDGEYQPGLQMSLGASTIPGAVDVNGNNVPVYRGTFGARKVRTNGANDANDGIIDELPMTFRVRLYFTPENTSKAGEQDKTFYIAEYTTDFSIKGGIPTGIVDVMNAKQVVGEKYYNPAGIESDTPFKGVNIVVTRYSDGSTTTTKILK